MKESIVVKTYGDRDLLVTLNGTDHGFHGTMRLTRGEAKDLWKKLKWVLK